MTKVARLTAGEKLAVNLLRGAKVRGSLSFAERQFDALADRARLEGLHIQDADCGYLGGDEAKLLAALTLLQRQRPELLVDIKPTLHANLRACAMLLAERGVRLEYRNMLRAAAATHRHVESTTSLRTSATRARIDDPFGNFAVQAELYRYVTAHGTVWFKELQNLGATRHVVTTMCKRGLIRRVRHGVYQALLCPGKDLGVA